MYLKVPGDSDVLGCRDALTVANLARTSVNRRCVETEASSVGKEGGSVTSDCQGGITCTS